MTNRKPCTVDGCSGTHAARGLCDTHYRRWQKRGTTDPSPPRAPRYCSVPGCEQPFIARDLCGRHYWRLRNTGTVEKVQRPRRHPRPLRLALAALPSDDCVLWTGYVGDLGYCTVSVGDGAVQVAHRRVYELVVGPVPDGLHLDHLCHNADLTCSGAGKACLHRRCVNPAHLEPVTPKENDARARARPTYVQPNRWIGRHAG